MGPRRRRMKTYHPRRRTRGKELHKQAIGDIKHRLSADIGRLIALSKEGNAQQTTAAQIKAKTDFLKYSDEMEKIALKMGEKYTKAIREYLNSVETLIHTNTAWIDEDQIRYCFIVSEKLDRELLAA